jgi:hypothetical protein
MASYLITGLQADNLLGERDDRSLWFDSEWQCSISKQLAAVVAVSKCWHLVRNVVINELAVVVTINSTCKRKST